MKAPRLWFNLSIINLFVVAVLGFLLRSKQLFEMQFIDYNHLVDAHGHFAFEGWATLSLLCLLVYKLLPFNDFGRRIYQWLLTIVFILSWAVLISMTIEGNSSLTNTLSALFLLNSYIFSAIFIRDILKAELNKSVLILAISSLIYFILSSAGTIAIVILFSVKSLNAIYYRDSQFTYLHLYYNGFFTLAVFALLFQELMPKVDATSRKHMYRFSILLILSVIPSMFLSYLWSNPPLLTWIIAGVGSVLVFLTFIWFVMVIISVWKTAYTFPKIIRYLGFLSLSSFALKEFLQSFTVFPGLNNAAFGSRPTVIGFLHLVFLGLVTMFILALYIDLGYFHSKRKFSNFALVFFSIGIILNEVILMIQGLGSMFTIGYAIFSWFLWGASIWLLFGSILINMAGLTQSKHVIAS